MHAEQVGATVFSIMHSVFGVFIMVVGFFTMHTER